MKRTFVFVNQKGGVGKTTSAVNIGAYLAEAGKNVLLVDFDSQANLSSGLGIKSEKNGIYEVISGKVPAERAVRKTGCSGLYVIPASIDLSGATVELINQTHYDQFLKNALSPLVNHYDFILIDCPPSLGVLTLNGLAAANGVLIPMQCEYFALEGLSMLLQTIKRIQQSINPTLTIDGIFFTMYDQRTRLAQQVVKHVGTYFKDRVFSTIIPRNVRLSEAPSHGLPISKYDAACQGALAYKNLADELIHSTEGRYGGN
jgi:chromosome partitioning protein